jgi:tetratricopeptide (TPR) repeat protein
MAPKSSKSSGASLTPVRTETIAKASPPKPVAVQPAAPKSAALPVDDDISEKTASGIKERDIPTQKAEEIPAQKAVAPVIQSSECKEALAERDLALEAPQNSDKLFHLRRALRLCPQSAPLHHELGKVYASMERRQDAESEFKQALSIDPSLSAAKNALSDLLKQEVQF